MSPQGVTPVLNVCPRLYGLVYRCERDQVAQRVTGGSVVCCSFCPFPPTGDSDMALACYIYFFACTCM